MGTRRTPSLRPARIALWMLMAALPLPLTALPADAIQPVQAGFDAGAFSQSTEIDNPYYPLRPGTQLVLEGLDAEGPHRLVVTVTDVVKVINGVRTLVVSERDYTGDTLAEDEIAFLAQDDEGNVWRLGEYPEEYDVTTGGFDGAPSTWIAGVKGSKPGLYMPAAPEPGSDPYFQVYAPNLHIKDQGEVIASAEEIQIGASLYQDVVLVREQNIREKEDCCQLKYHAPGVGNVRVEAEDDATGEFLDLVGWRELSDEELAAISLAVLEMDERAYEEAAGVYGRTEPATR